MTRRAETAADFEACAAILAAVDPEEQLTGPDLRRSPDGAFLLHDAGGYAFVAPSSVPRSAYAMVRVRPESRCRGVGSALLAAASERARDLEADSLWGRVSAGDDESMRFVSSRGFVEVGRDVELVRELRPGEGRIPAGIGELRDEHLRDAYAVAVETVPDMPTAGRAEARSFDDWAKGVLAGPVAFIALADGKVVGYASFDRPHAVGGRLGHGFTCVRRSHRGRGLATALGRAQIAWAASEGYRELVTETGETNAAMRAVKAKLGYVERASAILVRAALP